MINSDSLQLQQLVDFARQHSPFYAHHFQHLPDRGWTLTDLPLVDPERYWTESAGLKNWPVLTGTVENGIVFKTGGTTGGGKLSVYSREEWQVFVTSFGRSLSAQLKAGDRVANLFFAGDLYSSFLFIHGALSHMETPVCEYPFSGMMEPHALAGQLVQHDINVLVGVPAMLLNFAATMAEQQRQFPAITTLLFGSESLFAEQMQLLKQVFPHARVASIGCASVDAGLIGASTLDCRSGEHRVFEPETRVEIIDEVTGEPIDEMDRSGMLVVTNLTRRLMPLIRYPTGDRAAWREPVGSPTRKFVLQGRSSLGHRLRVGYASMFPDEIDALITEQLGKTQWQLLLEHNDSCDYVTLRIACSGSEHHAERVIQGLVDGDHALAEMIAARQLHLRIQWCQQVELICNPRTGKLLRVIDLRAYQTVGETS